jgi:GNAT superfamily N-acetyltransferase
MAIAAVRPAAVHDVDEIVRIQAGTWAAAYAELVPAAALEQLNGSAARQAWTDAVTTGAGHHVLVATEGDWTVGFCAAAAQQPTTDVETWGEIGALLVEPRWGRRGHGGRLLAAAAEAMSAAGVRYGLAWIPEPDEASRRFYARAGWEPDGAVRGLDTGDGTLREVRVTGSLELRLQP